MTTERSQGSLYTHIEQGVATVEFGHPSSNAFPTELLNRLAKAFDELSSDPHAHIILLKSEGVKTFCAGASFDELMAVEDLESGEAFFGGFAKVLNAMRRCQKPIVGRVQGKAVGGGVGLIAACDYAYATEAASVKLSEISIGIGPFVIAPAIERKIGVAGLAELTLAPTNWKTAYWAKEKGLFARVFESLAEMDEEIMHHTAQLAKYNPMALTAMKKALWEGTSHWEELLSQRAKISGELVLSDFTKQALQKFKS